MKKKPQERRKEIMDFGFGFPVKLQNVPMVKRRGEWVPDINYRDIARKLLRALCVKPARWTGNEVRFVRLQLEMTLSEFAEQFYVTHPAVVNWEKQGDKPTKMNWATEKDIRLFLYLRTVGEEEFPDVYRQLERKQPERPRRTKIDVREAVPT